MARFLGEQYEQDFIPHRLCNWEIPAVKVAPSENIARQALLSKSDTTECTVYFAENLSSQYVWHSRSSQAVHSGNC